MGKIISAIGSTIDDVVSSVSGAIQDVTGTAAQLTALGAKFAVSAEAKKKAVLSGHSKGSAEPMFDGEDIGALIKSTLLQAQKKSLSQFNTQFNSDGSITASSDDGLVQDYCGDQAAGVTAIVNQLSTDFVNWQIPSNNQALQNMASTIMQEIISKAGAGDTSYGQYSLTINQTLYWTVSYGLFDVTVQPTTQALIYAFTAGFGGGF
jgi:hypothetical protein